MRLKDGLTDVMVERDAPGSFVELQIAQHSEHDPGAEHDAGGTSRSRVVRLTREEARRVAALILLQADRLDDPLAKNV